MRQNLVHILALSIPLSPWEIYSAFVSLSFFLSKMEILPSALTDGYLG